MVFFLWDLVFLLMTDTAIRWKLAQDLLDKTAKSILWAMVVFWLVHFGPPRAVESGREGGATSDLLIREMERLKVELRFKGSQGYTEAGLAERHTRLTELAALKT